MLVRKTKKECGLGIHLSKFSDNQDNDKNGDGEDNIKLNDYDNDDDGGGDYDEEHNDQEEKNDDDDVRFCTEHFNANTNNNVLTDGNLFQNTYFESVYI